MAFKTVVVKTDIRNTAAELATAIDAGITTGALLQIYNITQEQFVNHVEGNKHLLVTTIIGDTVAAT